MLPKAYGCQRLATKGVKEHVGTYAAQGLGSSKASHHRREVAYRDSCWPKPKAVEG